MPNVMETIYAKAAAAKKRITLPEAEDVRTVAAAQKIVEQGLAEVILINSEEKIAAALETPEGRAKLDAQLADESRELLAAALETEEGQQRLAEILERQEAESVAVTTPEAGDDLEGSGSEN